MNSSEDCQCEEDQLAVVEWTKHVLEETLIPVVGTVGLLGNTLTILVLNRYHIAQGDHFICMMENEGGSDTHVIISKCHWNIHFIF